jgi:hypothetical protein
MKSTSFNAEYAEAQRTQRKPIIFMVLTFSLRLCVLCTPRVFPPGHVESGFFWLRDHTWKL